ncbi:MAG TPA: hypothetical protein VNM45_05755 [Bacillus sp. (in: firmicutes)]|nr:hypothetical protein [Bacillus sp. (in: firmicutes)]
MPSDCGHPYEFDAIAAVVIGGMRLNGGIEGESAIYAYHGKQRQ